MACGGGVGGRVADIGSAAARAHRCSGHACGFRTAEPLRVGAGAARERRDGDAAPRASSSPSAGAPMATINVSQAPAAPRTAALVAQPSASAHIAPTPSGEHAHST